MSYAFWKTKERIVIGWIFAGITVTCLFVNDVGLLSFFGGMGVLNFIEMLEEVKK